MVLNNGGKYSWTSRNPNGPLFIEEEAAVASVWYFYFLAKILISFLFSQVVNFAINCNFNLFSVILT